MQINGVMFSADCEEIINELQTQLHINGIDLLNIVRPTGDNIMIQCPFHSHGSERKPSAGIRKSDGFLNCFACGAKHSLQEVISFCFGHTDDIIGAFGWQWLLKNFATLQVEDRKDVKVDLLRNSVADSFTVKNHKLVSKDKSDRTVLGIHNTDSDTFVTEEELDSYRYTHPYWKKRGIDDEEIIELFDLGWSPDDDCITFPVRDTNGNCLFVAKRSTKTKRFYYPPSVKKSVYGLYELYQLEEFPKEVWITESMIDAIRLWQLGFYACALNGTGDSHSFSQIEQFPCRVLILATDMDDAGMRAREKIKNVIKGKIFKEVFLPNGKKDIGECSNDEIISLQRNL